MSRGRRVQFSSVDLDDQPLRPSLTPESRENQVIAAAYDLAEKQIRDGMASATVITHFLNLASKRTQLEQKYLEERTRLATAKTEEIDRNKDQDELFARAIRAIRTYRGTPEEEDEFSDGYY